MRYVLTIVTIVQNPPEILVSYVEHTVGTDRSSEI